MMLAPSLDHQDNTKESGRPSLFLTTEASAFDNIYEVFRITNPPHEVPLLIDFGGQRSSLGRILQTKNIMNLDVEVIVEELEHQHANEGQMLASLYGLTLKNVRLFNKGKADRISLHYALEYIQAAEEFHGEAEYDYGISSQQLTLTLGDVLFLLGDWEDALECYNSLLEDIDENQQYNKAHIIVRISQCYWQMGNHSGAQRELSPLAKSTKNTLYNPELLAAPHKLLYILMELDKQTPNIGYALRLFSSLHDTYEPAIASPYTDLLQLTMAWIESVTSGITTKPSIEKIMLLLGSLDEYHYSLGGVIQHWKETGEFRVAQQHAKD